MLGAQVPRPAERQHVRVGVVLVVRQLGLLVEPRELVAPLLRHAPEQPLLALALDLARPLDLPRPLALDLLGDLAVALDGQRRRRRALGRTLSAMRLPSR